MTKLTETLIQQRLKTCTTDLEKIMRINITGRELKDVSLLRKMTGVEILSLSVNNISSLADFQNCKNLTELYLRHNNVTDLNEIAYLQNLPKLELLMLSENPCAMDPLYRVTVIKNLKHLAELDGVPITAEERKDAAKLGKVIDRLGNCIPDGPQTQRTPTQCSQGLKPRKFSVVELMEAKPLEAKNKEDDDVFEVKRKFNESKENIRKQTSCTKVQSSCEMCGSRQISPMRKGSATRSFMTNLDPLKKISQCKFCKTETVSRSKLDQQYVRIISKNSNILSAALNLVKELDYPGLQIVNAEVSSRLNEIDYYCQPKA